MTEEYVLGGLKASGDVVLAGLGDVFAAGAGRCCGRRSSCPWMSRRMPSSGCRRVTGADGVTRTLAERGHSRPVISEYGELRFRRIAYRTRENGYPDLHVRDAVLSLPPGLCSWRVQEMVVRLAREVAYETVREIVRFTLGITISKRQIEQITAAAAGAPAFYAGPVFDVIPQPRTPAQVMAGCHGGGACRDAAAVITRKKKPAPVAVSRR